MSIEARRTRKTNRRKGGGETYTRVFWLSHSTGNTPSLLPSSFELRLSPACQQRGQLPQRLYHRNLGRACLRSARPRHEHGTHAAKQGTLDVVREAVADHHRVPRFGVERAQRGLEDARMRFHVPVVRRRDRGREEAVQLEVLLKGREAPLRVGNEPDLEPRSVQAAKDVGHILVQREVLARRPLVIDVARGPLYTRSGSAHHLDDALRVVDEDLRIVDASGRVQQGRGG